MTTITSCLKYQRKSLSSFFQCHHKSHWAKVNPRHSISAYGTSPPNHPNQAPYLHPKTIKSFLNSSQSTPKDKRSIEHLLKAQQNIPEKARGRNFSNESEKPSEPETLKLGVPPELLCPLTNTLFVQPVQLPNGNIYSRKALKDHLRENDRRDPLTNVLVPYELNLDLLPVHLELQQKVHAFIKNNPRHVKESLESHYKSILDKYELSSEVSAEVALSLGLCYLNGDGVPKNEEKAIKFITRAAESGLSDAMVELGKLISGQNQEEAFKYFKKASEMENAYGTYRVGLAYLLGKGVEENPQTALDYFTAAAEASEAGGFWGLGVCLLNGVGTQADPQQAHELFLKAAEMGMKRAQHMVGLMLRDGKHVPEHYEDAYYWFTQAAELGHVPSMVAAGTMIVRKLVENVPNEIAVIWFKEAAQKDDPQAFYNLALCFLNGVGVKPNLDHATHCLKRASSLGLTEAKNILKQLEKEIAARAPKTPVDEEPSTDEANRKEQN